MQNIWTEKNIPKILYGTLLLFVLFIVLAGITANAAGETYNTGITTTFNNGSTQIIMQYQFTNVPETYTYNNGNIEVEYPYVFGLVKGLSSQNPTLSDFVYYQYNPAGPDVNNWQYIVNIPTGNMVKGGTFTAYRNNVQQSANTYLQVALEAQYMSYVKDDRFLLFDSAEEFTEYAESLLNEEELSYNIPVPLYNVHYNINTLLGNGNVEIPAYIEFTNYEDIYDVDLRISYFLPSSIKLGRQYPSGEYVYTIKQWDTPTMPAGMNVQEVSNVTPTNNSINLNQSPYLTYWQSVLTNNPREDITWHNSDVDYDYAEAKLMYIANSGSPVHMGNIMNIQVRYKTGGMFGKWSNWWNSSNMQYNIAMLPQYSREIIPGYQNTTGLTPEDLANLGDISTISDPWAAPVIINNNNNISINLDGISNSAGGSSSGGSTEDEPQHDYWANESMNGNTIGGFSMLDAFSKTKTAANEVKTFTGGYGDFLTDMFHFIPAEIWTIITLGFGLAIVGMIYRIIRG